VVSLYQPADIALLFKDLSSWWDVAGGWAIDCFIGSETRSHADLDISPFSGVMRNSYASSSLVGICT
jgi:hypothetical protein